MFRYKVISHWIDRVTEHIVLTYEPIDLGNLSTTYHKPIAIYPVSFKSFVLGSANPWATSYLFPPTIGRIYEKTYVQSQQNAIVQPSLLGVLPTIDLGPCGFMSSARLSLEYGMFTQLLPSKEDCPPEIKKWLETHAYLIDGITPNIMTDTENAIEELAFYLSSTEDLVDSIFGYNVPFNNICDMNKGRIVPEVWDMNVQHTDDGDSDWDGSYLFAVMEHSIMNNEIDPLTLMILQNQQIQITSSHLQQFISSQYNSHPFHPIRNSLIQTQFNLSPNTLLMYNDFSLRAILDEFSLRPYTDLCIEVDCINPSTPAKYKMNSWYIQTPVSPALVTSMANLQANISSFMKNCFPMATRCQVIKTWLDEVIINIDDPSRPNAPIQIYADLCIMPLISTALTNSSIWYKFNEIGVTFRS